MGAWSDDTGAGTGQRPVTIVVGVDGSDASLRALAYAVGEGRRCAGHVIAAFVHPQVPAAASLSLATGAADAVLSATTAAAADAVATIDAGIVAARRDFGADIELRHLHGAPADELAHLADTVAADLVVVGASRHPANPVIASVGRRLSRHIAWPLTIVP